MIFSLSKLLCGLLTTFSYISHSFADVADVVYSNTKYMNSSLYVSQEQPDFSPKPLLSSAPQNYYLLALFYNPNHISYSNYTIHGLWAQYNVTSYPSWCKNQSLDMNDIQDLVPILNEVWVSGEGSNQHFWNHEWMKHGTCNWNGWKQHTYFANTILTHKYYSDIFPELCASQKPDPDGTACKIKFWKNLTIIDE